MPNEWNHEFFERVGNSIRHHNKRIIKEDKNYQKSISELKQIEDFLSGLGYLSFGRDYVFCAGSVFSLQVIMTSLELTMGSIISCCQNGCIADANSLLRKCRDDMFFYLYVLVYDSNFKLGNNSPEYNKIESTICSWLRNELKNFKISQVLQAITKSDHLKEPIIKYDLKSSFNEIGKRLNNYVHGNGYKYYNRNIVSYKDGELIANLKELVESAKYITVVFLFLMILCSPHYAMSTDYVDCLDMNETPPEGSQYWIAPFIQNFIKNNIKLIDSNCLDYLKNNTPMQFD